MRPLIVHCACGIFGVFFGFLFFIGWFFFVGFFSGLFWVFLCHLGVCFVCDCLFIGIRFYLLTVINQCLLFVRSLFCIFGSIVFCGSLSVSKFGSFRKEWSQVVFFFGWGFVFGLGGCCVVSRYTLF